MEVSTIVTSERESDIENWWGAGGNLLTGAHHNRLFAAFRHVLMLLPDDDFDRFMELRPIILCFPEAGRAFQFLHPVPPEQRQVRAIYVHISPECVSWETEELLNTIAHETAHLILGHPEMRPPQLRHETEAEADALSMKWGFKACYTPNELEKFKQSK
jgi:hypothetical protein